MITDRLSKNHYLQILHKTDAAGVDPELGSNSPLYQRSYGETLDFSSFYAEEKLDREALKKYPGYGLNALKTSYQNVWLTKLEFVLNNRAQFLQS